MQLLNNFSSSYDLCTEQQGGRNVYVVCSAVSQTTKEITTGLLIWWQKKDKQALFSLPISPIRKTTALMMACGEVRTLSEEPKDHEIGPGIDRPLDKQTSDRNTKKLSKSRMTPVSAMPHSYRSVDSL